MFKKALQYDPKHTPSKYHMGLMHYESGEPGGLEMSLKLFT